MRTIFRYAYSEEIHLPQGARFLHFGLKDDFEPHLWFEVESAAPLVPRHFQIYATGQPIPTNARTFCGTVSIGRYIWHLYELDGYA